MNPSSNDAPPESLLRLQERFAGHIRDPANVAPPEGIEDRRMAIYRRLFFGNLRNLMARNFPVLRRLIDDDQWDELIRRFMTDHRAHTPMFTQIGGEFVRFIEQRQPANLPPFALELAHWEFLETVVRLHEADPEQAGARPDGDLLEQAPMLNPTLQVAQYMWPVYRISPEFQPTAPLDEPLVLAACRRRNDKISFMRLNPVTGRLITLIQEQPETSGRQILRQIAAELKAGDDQAVIRSGADMLERLRENELILGTVI